MSDSRLWAASITGNVYCLGLKSSTWQHVHNEGQKLQGFKRVCAAHRGAWGLGCDHQVYVFVESADVPIRCQVSTFENERWVPSRGWSCRNLVRGLDPWQWSCEDGSVMLSCDSFTLPSESWAWEGDWAVDENVQGFLTDKGGWRYSNVGFRGQFTHQKTFKSCVRRRKWIRHYKYIATDVWAKIPSLHIEPMEEPIVDLSVGGQSIPNQSTGYMSVWIVTIDGRVLYRAGVSEQCPEGLSWVEIPLNEGEHVLAISTGPTDLVWAVTWSGAILVRNGINWSNPKGDDWVSLPAPDLDDKPVQVAVGETTAWVTSASGNVWMRKGIKPAKSEGPVTDEDRLTGSGWLHMVHRMRMVAVGPHDRVWGIDYDSRSLNLRLGISADEPSGRTWREISLSHTWVEQERTSLSSQSVGSLQSGTSVEYFSGETCSSTTPEGASGSDCGSLGSETVVGVEENEESVDLDTTQEEGRESVSSKLDSSHRGNCDVSLECTPCATCDSVEKGDKNDSSNSRTAQSKLSSVSTSSEEKHQHSRTSNDQSKRFSGQKFVRHLQNSRTVSRAVTHVQNSKTVSKAVDKSRKVVKFFKDHVVKDILRDDLEVETGDPFSVRYSTSSSSLKITPSKSVESGIEEEQPDRHVDAGETTSPSACSMTTDNPPDVEPSLPNLNRYRAESDAEEVSWLWVSANACDLEDESHIQHWFHRAKPVLQRSLSASLNYQRQISVTSWRDLILTRLLERRERDQHPYVNYSPAIEHSCWVKRGRMQWWSALEKRGRWIDADIELTQDSDSSERDGTFTVQYTIRKAPKHLTVSLGDVTEVRTLRDRTRAAVFGLKLVPTATSSAAPHLLIKLSASGEEEMEDWMASLSVACCDHRRMMGAPRAQTVWALSERGDIFVHEPSDETAVEPVAKMFWHQYGGHMKVTESCPAEVIWGIGYDGRAYAYTGGFGGAFFKGESSMCILVRATFLVILQNVNCCSLGMATSPHGIHTQSDTREMFVYENQRWRPLSGYTDRMLFGDAYKWSDDSGFKERTKNGTKLPSKRWAWTTDWMIDRRLSSGVDKEGWQYGHKLHRRFYSHPRINSVIRRRRWIRKCSMTTSGPWLEVAPHLLRDISLGVSPTVMLVEVPLWAVRLNGEMLYRMGVTPSNPQGTVWVHVPADVDFTSVSVGRDGGTWATARDGSVWLRRGLTPDNPIGDRWVQISPPNKTRLLQISAGTKTVWAVSSHNELFCRDGISGAQPKGTGWSSVCGNIQHVSCSSSEQVWVIQDKVTTSEGQLDGVICRRGSLEVDKLKNGAWDCGNSGDWRHISVRGLFS